MPTSWDETRILDGRPGEYVITARRKGSDWYVAAMTGDEARTVSIPTDFLPKGKYEVEIYNDDPSLETQTKVGRATRTIKIGSPSRRRGQEGGSIELNLQPSGGAALHLKPLSDGIIIDKDFRGDALMKKMD